MYCAAVRAFKKLSEFTLSIKFPFVLPPFYISLEKSVKSIEKKAIENEALLKARGNEGLFSFFMSLLN